MKRKGITKGITIILTFCCILSLIGCKGNKSSRYSEYVDDILAGMNNLRKQESGNITINTKMVSTAGNIESISSEKDELISLSYVKREDCIDYNYKVVERYNNESTETTIKNENNTLYTLSDDKWVKVDSPQVDYYNSVLSMLDFNYKVEDIQNCKVTQSDGYQIINIILDKKALSKNVNKLTYSYWIQEDQITKIIIEQVDTMNVDSETDNISTLVEINIMKN